MNLDDPRPKRKPLGFLPPSEGYKAEINPPPLADFGEDKAFNKRVDSFTKRYTNSPEFARKKSLFDDQKPDSTRAAVNRFDPNKHYDYGRKRQGVPAAVTQSWYGDPQIPFPPKIEIDPSQVRRLYSGNSTNYPKGLRPEPHEMGHIGVGGQEKGFSSGIPASAQNAMRMHMRPDSDKQWKRIRDVMSHKANPEEARSDLHELRFYMDEAGVFDASKPQPFTQEHLDQYRKQKGQYHRLFNKFDDKGVIWMMNNIAQSQQPKGMFTGKNRYA